MGFERMEREEGEDGLWGGSGEFGEGAGVGCA